jgi:hypothetical protein
LPKRRPPPSKADMANDLFGIERGAMPEDLEDAGPAQEPGLRRRGGRRGRLPGRGNARLSALLGARVP